MRFRTRSAGVLVCLLALLAGVLAPTGAAGQTTADPLEPAVAAALAGGGTHDLWVRMTAEADTGSARALSARTARGQRVVDLLKSTAARSQTELRALLDDRGLRYQSFWVTNAVLVHDAGLDVARELAGLAGVAAVRLPPRFSPPEPVDSAPAGRAAAAIEWGVANINADDVWNTYGDRGEGIVIANIDTGVQYDHPALVRQYRGNNGDGTFDHSYNWFDSSGTCTGAPCDKAASSHGTHTMGTMVGDDGAGNQIGVAPGAKWIAANGCATCGIDDLTESAQWMLAPTDLNGQNPDVAKRPHIVNNSWGTTEPTNDPLIEDILQAWADSGILGIWSNGNIGPGCATSGSPGSRTINYSVGAYDRNNRITSFSSRGPGQNGETKPNISAPGAEVRSAGSGGSYRLLSGTSMAAPHVAGAVALLWSEQPGLARDVATTRTLLDLSAVDTPDEQCGGTAEDNNVYGEGRLNALALVELGAGGGIGTLTGKVTDAGTGAGIPAATVTVTGPLERRVSTGPDGSYTLTLVPGDYQLAVSDATGYDDATAGAQVTANQTTTVDVALQPAARVHLRGVVTDGSGRGGPLHAKVAADDGAGNIWSAETDPSTGGYDLPVLPRTRYTVRVTAIGPGYTPSEQQVDVGTGDLTLDVALLIDLSCTAPGYRLRLDGSTQAFSQKPAGWQVTNVDHGLPGYVSKPGWLFTNPGGRPNNTGGAGKFVIVDSDHAGQNHVQDTYLTTPAFDLAARTTPAVQFGSDLAPAVNSTATVELSTDGGANWTTVWRNAGYPGARGPAAQVVPIPQAAGQARVKIRFHYTGQWSGWWQLDNVFVGDRTCRPV